MFRHLERYVVREIVAPFGLALLVATFILLTPPIAKNTQELLAQGVPFSIVVRVLALAVPQTLVVTIPMAFLVGVLVAFGRLSGDSEWVAMQACGVSLYRMLRPVLVVALLAWAATQWVTIEAVPWCSRAAREIQFNALATTTEAKVKPRVFQRFPGLVIYARDVQPGVPGWRDVFIAETVQPGQPVVYLARYGRLLVDRGRQQVQIVLEDGAQHSVTTEASGVDRYDANRFSSMILTQDPDRLFEAESARKDDEMSIAELRERAEERVRAGESPHSAIWYIHQKFSIPVACLVFAAIGLGFGVRGARSGRLAAFAVGLSIIFGYYILLYLSRSLVKSQLVPAAFGPWVPNIVMAAFGGLVLGITGRKSGQSARVRLPAPLVRLVAHVRGAFASADPVAPISPPRSNRTEVVSRLHRFGFPHVRIPSPLLIDRYIAVIYGRLLGLTFVGLLGLFYISEFLEQAEKLFNGTATLGMLLLLLWYSTPQFVFYVVPIAALLSTLITIGVLARNSELVVMHACGVSLYRVAVPLIVLGAIASVLLFGLQEQILASANREAEDLEQLIRHGAPRTIDRLNHRWLAGGNGEIYHYESFDPRRPAIFSLSIYEFDERPWRLRRRTFVSSAVCEALTPSGGTWNVHNGWVRDLDADGDTTAYSEFPARLLTLEPPDYFGSEQPEADRMTYGELRRYIVQMQAAGMNVVPCLVSLHQKISFPFAVIIVTVIAIPFAAMMGRHGGLYGLGVGAALAMIYWTANHVFGALGGAGLIAPVLAAWAPNILFGAAAASLLLTVNT
jgi:LPS export ABC transporter permease LptF/LPS export ABC transporter permease LptG